MKSLFSNTILILLARVFLGGLFIVAGLEKIGNPDAFITSILHYKVVGLPLATLTATILPALELLCGLSLVLGLYPRASAILMTAMLLIFTALVTSALLRGLDISCGCFTHNPDAGKLGYGKILENIGMMIVGIFLIYAQDKNIALYRLFPKKTETPHDTI